MTTHSFDVDEAIEYGVEPAILLANIRFWLEKNRANESHCYDGYYWTYNSAQAFSSLFPYMSARSISRHLKTLCDKGILLNDNYNPMKYDRKLWYTIPAEFAIKPLNSTTRQNGEWICHFGECISQSGESICQNGASLSQSGEPIANINTDNKQNINTDTTALAVTEKQELSEFEKACWKWAKKESFWSGKVYNEKAFLSHYNAESGALKGQFKNWQELNKTEEEKKVKPKVPEVWERQGFKSQKEYDEFMFKQQTEKYTKTKTGSLA